MYFFQILFHRVTLFRDHLEPVDGKQIFFFFKLKLPLQKINLPVIVFVPSNVTISPSNILREHCKHIQSDCFIEKQVEFGIKKKN